MQDLNNAQFKRDNIPLWLSLLKILSETKEKRQHPIMTFIVKNSKWNKGIRISVLCKYVGGWLKSIETEWALWFLNCFSLFLQNN